ncbi:hypothetical protein SASPL_155891 [Salvia splendens]|uniref:Auxin-responsive protein n=1 Tax=Salvia splendens TaxID=180675 RepID=A0A8X8VXT8_SALSN|nr:hypothetical protein SASPL_155891 [Salvia splendens]
MEGYSRKDEGCCQFLDLVTKEKEEVHARISAFSEEKKLELSLAPPGQDWTNKNPSRFAQNPWQQQASSHFLHLESQPCSSRAAPDLKNLEKKTFTPANLAVPNNSAQKRKTMFVKINMDGIPIGRKVDLIAYDSYEKLSFAVDELFRGLLAAQGDQGKAMRGLLDGNRGYTLVYEDNEGDRMLVGDVPWHMFLSTVKRLRVLKSSELPTLLRGGDKQRKHMASTPPN